MIIILYFCVKLGIIEVVLDLFHKQVLLPLLSMFPIFSFLMETRLVIGKIYDSYSKLKVDHS